MDEKISAENFITDAVNTYSDTIYRIALNITRNPQDAFDVCQDVFVKLIKHKDKIENPTHLKAWLIRVTINCSKSLVASAHRTKVISIDDVKESELVYSGEERLWLCETVMRLPEKYSTVIYLFYYEDMKISDIAHSLGVTESAVKIRLSRAREKLRKILEKEHYYD
ncbi:MAG: sigma-70 family RNA polymerase sigma factor [Ruminococcus sp.]|nr:sigma-70 family RNA polymerase sigma factor [Ruminococcus sp.]